MKAHTIQVSSCTRTVEPINGAFSGQRKGIRWPLGHIPRVLGVFPKGRKQQACEHQRRHHAQLKPSRAAEVTPRPS